MEKGIRLLIVDDSVAVCSVLSEMLINLGVEDVHICHSGESALEEIGDNSLAFDAIFVDLNMDGMDGLELMHQLHDMRYRGGVIVMSALESKIIEFTLEIISQYSLRILGSIEKPFERSLIAFIVKRVFAISSMNLDPDLKLLKRRELVTAIQENRVECYFQPKVDARTNRIVGIEALARIRRVDGRVQMPITFIPVAERFGVIGLLTDVMFENAAPQFLEFKHYLGHECTLSINVSPMLLYNDSLPEIFNEYAYRFGLDKQNVVLEITENHALRDGRQLKNLNRLGIQGFTLSLDDYGAGFTNLRQLKKFPFKEIKMDAQLIRGICRDKVLQIIVESIRDLCRDNSMRLVAEGIDDSHDLAVLDEIGVDCYQGFLFCRPRPVADLIRWHRSWQKVGYDDVNQA